MSPSLVHISLDTWTPIFFSPRSWQPAFAVDASVLLDCTSFHLSQVQLTSPCHHFSRMDLHRWCIMMQHHQISTSMVSASVEDVQNQFEPPNQEDVCICLSLPISIQHSLSGLDFSVSDLRRTPSVSLSLCECWVLKILLYAFQAGPHIGCQCRMGTFRPSAMKKSKQVL